MMEGNGISFISGIYLVHGTVFAGVPWCAHVFEA